MRNPKEQSPLARGSVPHLKSRRELERKSRTGNGQAGAGSSRTAPHPPEHGEGERGLDPSQDLQGFLLPPLVGLAVPPRATGLPGSDVPYPAEEGGEVGSAGLKLFFSAKPAMSYNNYSVPAASPVLDN